MTHNCDEIIEQINALISDDSLSRLVDKARILKRIKDHCEDSLQRLIAEVLDRMEE